MSPDDTQDLDADETPRAPRPEDPNDYDERQEDAEERGW